MDNKRPLINDNGLIREMRDNEEIKDTLYVKGILEVASNGLQGKFQLDSSGYIFTIEHPEIDSTKAFPVVSLDTPEMGSNLFVVGIFDRTDTSFKVELSGIPDNSYNILWHINSVAAISIENLSHNSLGNIQGGQAGEYFHLNEEQYNDYIGSTEVASISASLQEDIDSLELNDLLDVNITGAESGDFLSFNGSNWVALAIASGGSGNLLSFDKFTSNGTWNKPEGATKALVICQGGGGGGGGYDALGGGRAGTGGGAGRFIIEFITSGLGETETVVVGGGGAGGGGAGGTGAPGGNGGSSSFGSHVSAEGGWGSRGIITSTTATSTTCAGSNGCGLGGGRGGNLSSGNNALANSGAGGGGMSGAAANGGAGGSGFVIIISYGG